MKEQLKVFLVILPISLLVSFSLVGVLVFKDCQARENKVEEKLLQQYYEVEGGSIYTNHKGDTYFVENQDIEWLLVEVNKDGEVLNIK